MNEASPSAIECLKSGQKLYQSRARKVLPILVRQAFAGKKLYYSDLAAEINMPNPRNLNYVLGCIGSALNELSDTWREDIPPIQCLVVNINSNLPGDGVGWFARNMDNFGELTPERQREIFESELYRVFFYPSWKDVLDAFGLRSLEYDFNEDNDKARRLSAHGESEHHKNLKEYVAKNPSCIKLPETTENGEIEYPLPSGDSLDVSFFTQSGWIAVEVKSSKSSEGDIIRGLYQCVKYQAVMKAVEISKNKLATVRAVLVLGGSMPVRLIPLKNLLGISVFENIGG